ncbi:hypothetical protein ACW9YQ_14775 (plasmid) [Paraburkholderia strydomiana]
MQTVSNTLCASHPVERTSQALEHFAAQAEFPRDDFDVVRSV